MVIHHLKCATRNAQADFAIAALAATAEHATTPLRLTRLGIYILFLTAVVFFYPVGAKADDLGQKVARIVKDFEQQIVGLESGNEYFIVVRSFFDVNSKQPSKRSEEVTDSFFINIRDRYFGKSNVVILNWRSIKPFEIEASSNADEIFYKQGPREQKLVENFGKGFLVTGTTATAAELVEIHAKLIDMTTGKQLASSKATLPSGPDDVMPVQKRPPVALLGAQEVVQAQKKPPAAPLTAVAAAPPNKEMPSEKNTASDALKTEMPLREKLKDLQYKVMQGINSRYEGYVKNGKKHGQGTLYFKNGDKYIGEWREDKKHGQGTYIYADAEKYVGQWKDGRMHGKGTYFFKSGNKFTGQWREDKKHGPGTYFFKNGDQWKGSYVNNKKHGRGVYTWVSGESQEEVWENGKLVK
jgi:hypothetical protein